MNREDIIRMAREVGYPLVEYEGEPYIPPMLAILLKTAAAAEREACAKVCDELHYAADAYGAQCAEAIRARGTNHG
jgi:hypothetical protein